MTKKQFQLGSAALAAAMLLSAWPGQAAPPQRKTALDAFNALTEEIAEPPLQEDDPDFYLDRIMQDLYAVVPEDPEDAVEMAADLAALCLITNSDLASYASRNNLLPAQVRHAYYQALAAALKAYIILYPSSDEKYRDIQTILRLFLYEDNVSGNDEQLKNEIRDTMSAGYGQQIAGAYNLPSEFVEALVMDRGFYDGDWTNDNDWRREAASAGDSAGTSASYTIGSRDSAGKNDISAMQTSLKELGYLRGSVDGVFGPKTQAALLEFQLANGIPATGTYTSGEYNSLLAADPVARWDYGDSFWDPDDWLDDDRYDDYDDDDDDDRYDNQDDYFDNDRYDDQDDYFDDDRYDDQDDYFDNDYYDDHYDYDDDHDDHDDDDDDDDD